MSLTKCPSCNAEVSAAAKTCPTCGHPIKWPIKYAMMYLLFGCCFPVGLIWLWIDKWHSRRTKIIITSVIGGLFGLSMISNLIAMRNPAYRAMMDAPSNSQSSSRTSAASPIKNIGIGERVEVGNFAFTINGVNIKKSIGDNQFSRVTTEGQFLLVDITAENISNESRLMDANLLRFIDAQGREFEYSHNAQMAIMTSMSGSNQSLFLEQVSPGITRRGKVAFEVPVNARQGAIEIRGGLLSGAKIYVPLTW